MLRIDLRTLDGDKAVGVINRSSNAGPGECQECLNSMTRGYTMPAFMFEKISPPAGGSASSAANGSGSSTVKKQRGVIVQILDRFVETRVKRTLREDRGVDRRDPPKSQG